MLSMLKNNSRVLSRALLGLSCLISSLNLATNVDAGHHGSDSDKSPEVLMLGDGGLLQPQVIVRGSRIFYMATHAWKAAENNPVKPTDRFSFQINSLQNVATGRAGAGTRSDDIQEFRFLAEKTILDGNVSVELLLPFYNTTLYESSSETDFILGSQIDTQFGDLGFGVKGLLWNNECSAVSAGLRVETPTKDDYRIWDDVRSDDSVWHFTPYISGRWNNRENWFASGFLSYRLNDRSFRSYVVGSGNDVLLREPEYLAIDGALGCWLCKRERGCGIADVAAMFEVHYTSATTRQSNRPTGLLQGIPTNYDDLGYTDYLNLTIGCSAFFDGGLEYSGGFAFPLRDTLTPSGSGTSYISNTDRSYSWAFVSNVGWRF